MGKKELYIWGSIIIACAMTVITLVFKEKQPEPIRPIVITTNQPAKRVDPLVGPAKAIKPDIQESKIVEQKIFTKHYRQSAVIAFEENISAIENASNKAFAQQQKAANSWFDGQIDGNSAYEIINLAREECERIKKDIGFIQQPEGLSDDVNELLAGARTGVIMAYTRRQEALDNLLKYIDDKKPGNLHEYKEKLKEFRALLYNGSMNLVEAKKKVNIDIAGGRGNAGCGLRVEAVYYAPDKSFVFISGDIYRINDRVCSGVITDIQPDKLTIKSASETKEYSTGDVIR